jgi:hypothetical protein
LGSDWTMSSPWTESALKLPLTAMRALLRRERQGSQFSAHSMLGRAACRRFVALAPEVGRATFGNVVTRNSYVLMSLCGAQRTMCVRCAVAVHPTIGEMVRWRAGYALLNGFVLSDVSRAPRLDKARSPWKLTLNDGMTSAHRSDEPDAFARADPGGR